MCTAERDSASLTLTVSSPETADDKACEDLSHTLAEINRNIAETKRRVAQYEVAVPRKSGGRAFSVLPPHHIVLARREQLVRDLSAGFDLVQKKYALNYPG